MGARFYDPALGRWLSADTLVPDPGSPQSYNRYAYVGGNPLGYVDPTGHARYGGDDYDPADEPLPPPVETPEFLAWLDLALSHLPLQEVLELLPVNIRVQMSEVVLKQKLRTSWFEHEMEARVSWQAGTASPSPATVFPPDDTIRFDTGTGYIQCHATDGRIQVASNAFPVEGSIGEVSYSTTSRGIAAMNVPNGQSPPNVQVAIATPTKLQNRDLQFALTPSVSIKQTYYPKKIAMTALGVGIVAIGVATAPEIFIPFVIREGWRALTTLSGR